MKERLMRHSTSKGFAVLGTSSILCKLLAIIYLPIQTAIVGYYGNGVINKGYKIYIFMYSLSNVGLPSVISKFVSELEARGDYRGMRNIMRCAFTILITFGAVLTVALFTGAEWFASVYCDQPNATLMLKVISPVFLLTAINCALRGYFQGRQNMMPTAISQLVEQAFNTVFTVVFVYVLYQIGISTHADAIAYAAAGSSVGTFLGALGASVFLLFLFFFVFKTQRENEYRCQTYNGPEQSAGRIYLEMFKYVLPAIISTVATSAIDQIDITTITRLLEKGGYTERQAVDLFSIYSTQYQRLFVLALAFTAPLVTAMIPSISSAYSVGRLRLFRKRVLDSYKLNNLIMLPCIAGLTFLAKPVITLIFLTKNAGDGLVILGTWTAIFAAVLNIQTGILIAIGRPLVSPLNTIVGMLFKIACNMVLIPLHAVHIYGAVIGNAVAWVIAIILNQYFIDSSVKGTRHNLHLLLVPASISLFMGICSLFVYKAFYLMLFAVFHMMLLANDLSVLIAAVAGILIYFTLMIKLCNVKADVISRLPFGDRVVSLLCRLPFLADDLKKGPA